MILHTTFRIAILLSVFFYGILWMGGVISSLLWGEAPASASWAAPVFLYISSLLLLKSSGVRSGLLLLAVGIYGFGIEILGLTTGVLFGDYTYSGVLGPGMFGVPYALVSSWMVVTSFAVFVLVYLRIQRKWWVLVGPPVMVIIDLILEPAATGPMGAWIWESLGGYYGVPINNFVGWFIASIPIFTFLSLSRYSYDGSPYIAASVLLFFLVLSVVHFLWAPVFIALIFVALMIFWKRLRETKSSFTLALIGVLK
ncbi:MAG: carotenoid biosynthesis protein [SAR202 cluster bacterium]|nr:carotenoid biosynthesis protein [SAR202 cluster bacterium]|tara:strand:+ start:16947 stop:17711 length:765 start_codon:yes stop_codon:yes gene_type:complete